MDPRERQKILSLMLKTMNERQVERARIQSALSDFVEALFDSLENAVMLAQQAGIRGYATPQRHPHPAENGLSILEIFIEDWSVQLVPMIGAARPALRDEPQVTGSRLKELVGRVGVFIPHDPDQALYDFIVFGDGSWFAWGYGWPKAQSSLQGTDFEQLALELLLSFGRDIFTTWPPRDETSLSAATDAHKAAYTYHVLRGDD